MRILSFASSESDLSGDAETELFSVFLLSGDDLGDGDESEESGDGGFPPAGAGLAVAMSTGACVHRICSHFVHLGMSICSSCKPMS